MPINKEPAERRARGGLNSSCLLGGELDKTSPKTLTPQGAARQYRDEAQSLTGAAKWAALSLAHHFARAAHV